MGTIVMNTLYELKSLDLPAVEKVILENILEMMTKKEKLVEEIKNNADDYNKVIKAATELKVGYGYGSQLNTLKKQLIEYGSVETLTKIINQEKFAKKYGGDLLIPTYVLPDLSSYDKVKSTNPKAAIYSKLGATVIL